MHEYPEQFTHACVRLSPLLDEALNLRYALFCVEMGYLDSAVLGTAMDDDASRVFVVTEVLYDGA